MPEYQFLFGEDEPTQETGKEPHRDRNQEPGNSGIEASSGRERLAERFSKMGTGSHRSDPATWTSQGPGGLLPGRVVRRMLGSSGFRRE